MTRAIRVTCDYFLLPMDFCFGWGNVSVRNADHWYMRESVVPLGSQMDRILNRTVVIIAHRAPNGSVNKGQNVGFLSRFYAEFLPGIKTCVVEQGGRGTTGPSDLPAECSYLLV
jgi:hypothetical protein